MESHLSCPHCRMMTVSTQQYFAAAVDNRLQCWCFNCGAYIVYQFDERGYLKDDPDVRLCMTRVSQQLRSDDVSVLEQKLKDERAESFKARHERDIFSAAFVTLMDRLGLPVGDDFVQAALNVVMELKPADAEQI